MFVEWMGIVAIMELESKLLRGYHKMELELEVTSDSCLAVSVSSVVSQIY